MAIKQGIEALELELIAARKANDMDEFKIVYNKIEELKETDHE